MNRPKNILLVEDDRDDQDTFIKIIKEIPDVSLFNIAANGKEALDILKNNVALPDLIFMDINMPVMDGITCIEELQKYSRLREIPVVILSANGNKKQQAINNGAKAFIEKQVRDSLLRNAIERVIQMISTHRL